MNRFLSQCVFVAMAIFATSLASAQQPADFSQALYYLYSNNMQDQWGEYTDVFLNLRSCTNATVEATSDLSEIRLKTYAGMEVPGDGLVMYRKSAGHYEMPLGQAVYTHSVYGDVVLATYDSNLRIYDTDGSLPFTLHSSSLECDYDGWLYGYCPKAGNFFSELTCKTFAIYRPNAMISYSNVDDNGITTEQVDKPVLVEYTAGEDNFSINGILPRGESLAARFIAQNLPTGEKIYVYDKRPVAPSGYDSEGARTGYYQLRAVNKTEGGAITDNVIGSYNAALREFTWNADCYLMGVIGYDHWTVTTDSGLSLGTMSRATVKIDSSASMPVATYETDMPAEYFTLQGIKVARPIPGQIYIEKRGSQVRKLRF